MPDNEKPLPGTPTSAFGQRSPEDGSKNAPLMADQIAKAVAEGSLEEFIDKEMPDNEHARKLVSMMMGMTGMPPPEGIEAGPVKAGKTGRDTTPAIDKEIIDQLIRIAADNNLTLDWLTLRALKLYVEEYLKTGRL